MNKAILGLWISFICFGFSDGFLMEKGRERFLLDEGWRFWIGKAETGEKITANGSTIDPYQTFGSYSKTGWAGGQNQAVSPAGSRFDDWGWRKVDLPHDWAVELHFTEQGDVGHGCKMIGPQFPVTSIAWYRRTFTVPKSDQSRKISIEFDGVYRDCEVYLNGHYLGRNFSGYAPFSFDISSYLNYGKTNSLALKVNATGFEGWFYEGAGIYRHVWLVKTAPVHIKQWGTTVRSEIKEEEAVISVLTEVMNSDKKPACVSVKSRILNAKGEEVGSRSSDSVWIDPGGEREIVQKIDLEGIKRWTIEEPYLYKVENTVLVGGREVDQTRTSFGLRTIYFDPEKGFFLNGKRTFLKGTCNHQDHAGVGVGLPDRVNEWRLERLKEMGCNAYRSAHHPPTREILEFCDRMGILVMDETRSVGSTEEAISQLDRLVRRDRNHPCVILWSLGNEEMEIQGTDVGKRILEKMNLVVKRLDPTRPTTIGMNGQWGKGFSEVVDVQGGNYMKSGTGFDLFHEKHPQKPVIGSEEYSATTTRGIYENNEKLQYVHADEMKSVQPNWASPAEEWWNYYKERPFLGGGFAWTGFDYRGEPTPYHFWPSISSHFGIMDTCGFAKDVFYYYQAWWTTKPVLHLLPHWNWPGKEGQSIEVRCDGNAEEIELFLNDQSLGRKQMPRNRHLNWQVTYIPGTLAAKGYTNGKLVSSTKVESTGSSVAVHLVADRKIIRADGEDVSMITVEVKDVKGKTVPTANNEIFFEIQGEGRIIGVGNGDPRCHEPDQYVEELPRSANIEEWNVKLLGKKGFDLKDLSIATLGSEWEEAYFNHERMLIKKPGDQVVYRGKIKLNPLLLEKSEAYLHLGPIEGRSQVFVEGVSMGKFDPGHVSCVVPSALLKKDKAIVYVLVKGIEEQGGMLKGGKMVFRSTAPLPWKRSLFSGLAQVIVKSTKKSGEIRLQAFSKELLTGELLLKSTSVTPRPYVKADY